MADFENNMELCAHDFQLSENLRLDTGKELNYFRCTKCGKNKFEIDGRQVTAHEFMLAKKYYGPLVKTTSEN